MNQVLEAIIYYTDIHKTCSDFPIFSKMPLTIETILRIKEVSHREVIVTDGDALPTYLYYGPSCLEDIDPEFHLEWAYLTSFTQKELEFHKSSPGEVFVLEIYNGYRE